MDGTVSRLGLGTVQFGASYGVTNADGQPSALEVGRIVQAALGAGIRTFDTAPAYGSEALLAAALGHRREDVHVVTKTAPGADPASGLRDSLAALGIRSVHGLLVHNTTDLTGPNGSAVTAALRDLRADGLVERIGFSVYDPDELAQAREVLDPDIVQLPLNLADQRFRESGLIEDLADHGAEVHVRSAYLQGVLLARVEDLPRPLTGLRKQIVALEELARAEGVSRLVAPLRFCLETPGVATVLVGVNSLAELEQALAAAECRIDFDAQPFAIRDRALVDPRTWG